MSQVQDSPDKDNRGHVYIVDQNSVMHFLQAGPDEGDIGAEVLHNYLNNFLKQIDGFCDGTTACTGVDYLYQDPNLSKARTPRGIGGGTNPLAVNGTTADLIRVVFLNGRMINVTSIEAYAPTSGSQKTLDRTLSKKAKDQANQVAVYADSQAKYDSVAGRAGDSRFRLVLLGQPDSDNATIDTGADAERRYVELLKATAGAIDAIQDALDAPVSPRSTPTPGTGGGGSSCSGGNLASSCSPNEFDLPPFDFLP